MQSQSCRCIRVYFPIPSWVGVYGAGSHGGDSFGVLTKEEMLTQERIQSQSWRFSSSPWKTWHLKCICRGKHWRYLWLQVISGGGKGSQRLETELWKLYKAFHVLLNLRFSASEWLNQCIVPANRISGIEISDAASNPLIVFSVTTFETADSQRPSACMLCWRQNIPWNRILQTCTRRSSADTVCRSSEFFVDSISAFKLLASILKWKSECSE